MATFCEPSHQGFVGREEIPEGRVNIGSFEDPVAHEYRERCHGCRSKRSCLCEITILILLLEHIIFHDLMRHVYIGGHGASVFLFIVVKSHTANLERTGASSQSCLPRLCGRHSISSPSVYATHFFSRLSSFSNNMVAGY